METGTNERVGAVDGDGDKNVQAGQDVQVTIDYLPATAPFHSAYAGTTILETVRTDAMTYFGVRDRQERDTYRYFLEFEHARVTNTAQTLDELLGPHRRGAHFNLIEEITAGAASA